MNVYGITTHIRRQKFDTDYPVDRRTTNHATCLEAGNYVRAGHAC